MRSPVLVEMFPLMTQPGGGSAQPWGQPVSVGGGAGGSIRRRGFGDSKARGTGAGGDGGTLGAGLRVRRRPAASRRGRTIAETEARNLGLRLQRSIQEVACSIPTA